MKTRAGFVSNSSSSSFIVGFSEKPTIEKLQRILFGHKKQIESGYGKESGMYDTKMLTKIVYDDLVDQSPMTCDEIIDAIQSGWPPPDRWDWWHIRNQHLLLRNFLKRYRKQEQAELRKRTRYNFPEYDTYFPNGCYADPAFDNASALTAYENALLDAAREFYRIEIAPAHIRLEFYQFEYGNDAPGRVDTHIGVTLEQSGIFRNLIHWRISKH